MNPDDVRQIEFFTFWHGFGAEPDHAKLTIASSNGRFTRQQRPGGAVDEVSRVLIEQLLLALNEPCVPKLVTTLCDAPAAAVHDHYESVWTNDHPALLTRLMLSNGRVLGAYTCSQHEFMLPLVLTDSNELSEEATFNPRLSRALADLMPEGCLNKARLSGRRDVIVGDHDQQCAAENPAALLGGHAVTEEAFESTADAGNNRSLFRKMLQLFRRWGSSISGTGDDDRVEGGERIPLYDVWDALAESDVQRLRSLRAALNADDGAGQTALMHAAFPPFNREHFRLLVEAGADLEARRCDGSTGLLQACSGGMADAAVEWISAGANLEVRTAEGETPLMHAAPWGDIVKILLAAGADVNAKDNDGKSALTHAVLDRYAIDYQRKLQAIKALIDAGADVNCRDVEGGTILGHARMMWEKARIEAEVVGAFRQHTGIPVGMLDNTVHMAEAIVKMLEAAGARQ